MRAVLLTVLTAAASVVAAPAAQPVDLAALAGWNIVVAEDAIESEVYAAQEFQSLYQRAGGVKLPIVRKIERPDRHVFVGPGKAMRGGAVGFDRSYSGGLIELDSRVFHKGLGTVAPSEISYNLGGRFRWFRADVGLTAGLSGEPPSPRADSEEVVFEVWGDGRRLYHSPVMGWKEGQRRSAKAAAAVSGVNEMTLKILAVSETGRCQGAAAWGGPMLRR